MGNHEVTAVDYALRDLVESICELPDEIQDSRVENCTPREIAEPNLD